MKSKLVVLLILAFGNLAASEPMQCNIGAVIKTVGGTEWQVSSCSDGWSLVFATMAGNPAMPFVFIVQRDGETAKISGEGNGSKEHSAAAYDELKNMTAAQFDELVQATMDVADGN
jgi:hypothetical protein